MSKIEQLLSQEMTRQQFLVTLGVSIVSLFGLSTIVGLLTNNDPKTNKSNHLSGYGGRNYGH